MQMNPADGTPVCVGLLLPDGLQLLCSTVWLLETTNPIWKQAFWVWRMGSEAALDCKAEWYYGVCTGSCRGRKECIE